jgi:outer membrane protein OmpA-like peptidoglycan-associated protein
MNFKNILFPRLIILLCCIASCRSISNVQTTRALGTIGGEALGQIFGEASGNADAGAAIGANIGEVTGAALGSRMDKQASDIKTDITNAKVDRVGDSIVVEFNSRVLFKPNKSVLSDTAKKSLDKLVKVFAKYPNTLLEVRGHTDNKGSDDFNLSLSKARASSVATYFINKGINSDRISARGLGKLLPKYDNNSSKGRILNCRVELVITANKQISK